ncbi:MAG: 16S rRNA (cytosine(1402)-N(4))-methyltransferase [Gammaproteobacteria bacterium]|nr:16S rRNA (cytosine(1402)-N(4))-methyltransferase [Gammaproteobacteria bacterium]
MNNPISLTAKAHQIIQEVLGEGDIAVDATIGNGHDTLFLAQIVGNTGKVYGFDIQQEALDNTYQKLKANNAQKQVALYHAGHETMSILLPESSNEKIRAIMFNLGYLPGGDKNRTTGISTTLAALEASFMLLTTGGRITILAYTGHPGGQEETEAVKEWVRGLPAGSYRAALGIQTARPPSGNDNITERPELIVVDKM